MKIRVHTKIGDREEEMEIDFNSESKSDCETVRKYISEFQGVLVIEHVTDSVTDEEFLEKLRNSKMTIIAS